MSSIDTAELKRHHNLNTYIISLCIIGILLIMTFLTGFFVFEFFYFFTFLCLMIILFSILKPNFFSAFTQFVSIKNEHALFITVIEQVWGSKILYDESKGYTTSDIRSSQLLKHFTNDLADKDNMFGVDSSDMVFAKWNDIEFTLADISITSVAIKNIISPKLSFAVSYRNDNLQAQSYLLFRASYPFDFEGQTWVQPKYRKFITPQSMPVNLESSEFDKIYRASTTDQVGARMALQTDIISAMIDLEKVSPGKNVPSYTFIKNELWIAIPINRKWMDLNLFVSVPNQLQNTKQMLEYVSQIAIKLKLNSMGNHVK